MCVCRLPLMQTRRLLTPFKHWEQPLASGKCSRTLQPVHSIPLLLQRSGAEALLVMAFTPQFMRGGTKAPDVLLGLRDAARLRHIRYARFGLQTSR